MGSILSSFASSAYAASASTSAAAMAALSLSAPFGTRLGAAEVEELRVLTGLPPLIIVDTYMEFTTFADVAQGTELSLAAFYKLPYASNTPLREQLAVLFGYTTTTTTLSFRQYLLVAAQFSPAASREVRSAALFRLYDADADGKISKEDLLFVLSKTVSFESGGSGHVLDPLLVSGGAIAKAAKSAPREYKLPAMVDKVFEETSTDYPARAFISKDDFIRMCRQVESFDHRTFMIGGGKL